MKILFSFIFCVVVSGQFVAAQQAQPMPFAADIQNFKKQDSINPPPKHAILFVGSSSFTKWTDVQNYFAGYTIINRGFGGSTLPDVIYYANDIIIPYQPKQVVIYCGENDFVSSDTVTAAVVANRFIKLFEMIRAQLPQTSIVFVSIKPSPSRRQYWDKMIDANLKIKDYITAKSNASFVNVYNLMLNNSGQAMPEIFLSDSLHMNEKGYAIWQKAIQPYLSK